MFESEEQKKRVEIIITLLAKLYVVIELSVDNCPVCHKPFAHDLECPIALAWTLLTEDQQRDARAAIRALALSIGTDDTLADPMVH